MRKIVVYLFLSGIILGFISSCGQAYEPMTTEELEAKVDSLYQVKATEWSAEMAAKCDSALEDHVKSRILELKNQ